MRLNSSKLLVERKVSLSASSSPSRSQSGKLGEDTRQTFGARAAAAPNVSPGGSLPTVQPSKPTEGLCFPASCAVKTSLLVLASLAVNSRRWNLLKLRRKTANRPDSSQPKSLSLLFEQVVSLTVRWLFTPSQPHLRRCLTSLHREALSLVWQK